MFKNEVNMSNGSGVIGNVPKTHFFAPNSEPGYPTSTTPPKGTSTLGKNMKAQLQAVLELCRQQDLDRRIIIKKVVYMGRSEVGGGETCFCEKRGPLRLLRKVRLPSQLLIKQWN